MYFKNPAETAILFRRPPDVILLFLSDVTMNFQPMKIALGRITLVTYAKLLQGRNHWISGGLCDK